MLKTLIISNILFFKIALVENPLSNPFAINSTNFTIEFWAKLESYGNETTFNSILMSTLSYARYENNINFIHQTQNVTTVEPGYIIKLESQGGNTYNKLIFQIFIEYEESDGTTLTKTLKELKLASTSLTNLNEI